MKRLAMVAYFSVLILLVLGCGEAAQPTAKSSATSVSTVAPTIAPKPTDTAAALTITPVKVEPTNTIRPTDVPVTNTPRASDTPRATNTLQPTDTPQATDTPRPSATPGFQSGGIGLSKRDWETKAGRPNSTFQNSASHTYEGKKIGVEYWPPDSFSQVVDNVNHTFDAPVSLEEAQKIARAFIPSDSEYVKTFDWSRPRPAAQLIVDLYTSRALANQITVQPRRLSPWQDAEPGTFVMVYVKSNDGKIVSWSIEPGPVP